MKLAILGAGVSGLALARYLVEGGFAQDDIHIFEASPFIGGLCRSKTVDGFTYDIAGGHILYSKDAEAMSWMKDCAGGDKAFVQKDRNTKIRYGQEHWIHYPFENGIGDLPKEANFDCLSGYVQAWHDRLMNGTVAPSTFGKWVQWRFGDGIAKHFMDPYNEKIWKRDLDFITSDWVAGRVPDAPIEDVLRSSVGIRTEGYTHQAIFYYPKQGGFQAITDGLASTLTDRIRLNTRVEHVVRHGDGWRVDGEDFDRVVNTIAMNELPGIVEGLPDDVSAAMSGLAYNSIVCYLVALDRPEHPNLSWVYLPQHAQGPVNRVTYMSNYSPGNAPEGKTSFLFEVTVRGGSEAPCKELEDEVLRGVEASGMMKRDEVLFTDRTFSKYAYIVYDHDLEARRKKSIDWCEQNQLHPLGRFGHYDYFNSDQCVIAATEMATRLMQDARTG